MKSDSPVHARRTLDQYGYPSLRSTDDRDEDQVLYKYTKSSQQQPSNRLPQRLSRQLQETKESKPAMPTTLLMVDTLWLWVLADDTILTFSPRREKEKRNKKQKGNDLPVEFKPYEADPIIDLLQSIKKEKKWEVKDCFDLVALLIYYCVDSLLRGSVESNIQVFRVFEAFASDKINAMTASYHNFRRTQRQKDTQFDIGEDLNNSIELRDIIDEIGILQKLIEEQRKLLHHVIKIYEGEIIPHVKSGERGITFLKFADNRLDDYEEQLDTLKKSASQARISYTELIQLKESHSGVREAHIASEQARIVNIFTLVTIIFSPLSFFAGIFGMVSIPSITISHYLISCLSCCSFTFNHPIVSFAHT